MIDLINKADAIEAIKKEIQDFEANYMHGEDNEEYGHDIGFVAGLHRAKTLIRSLPSAEYVRIEIYRDLYEKYIGLKHKTEWTPICSELPEMNEDVLVTLWGNQLEIGYFNFGERGIGLMFCANDFEIRGEESVFEEVDAWKPLPKPYKGGDDE